jgi:hypothetical protein
MADILTLVAAYERAHPMVAQALALYEQAAQIDHAALMALHPAPQTLVRDHTHAR